VTEAAELRERLDAVGNEAKNRWYRYRGYYMDQFAPKVGWKLLDFGAYIGANLLHFHDLGFSIEGIEGSSACVRDYRERTSYEFHYPTMRCCLIEEFDPGSKRYDAVICGEVLHQSDDPRRIFAKAREVLKPDGALFIATPVAELKGSRCAVTVDNLLEWYAGAGFTVDVIVRVGAPRDVGCVDQFVAGGRLTAAGSLEVAA
jgi:2-polyprenyl-3-methyl-5-hydroxy-6-metoxy-1,4-benzoquinol methylase